MRDYAMQISPQTIDVRRLEAFDPFRILSVVAPVSGHWALVTGREAGCFFWILTSGFQRMFRIPGLLLSWDKEASLGWDGYVPGMKRFRVLP